MVNNFLQNRKIFFHSREPMLRSWGLRAKFEEFVWKNNKIKYVKKKENWDLNPDPPLSNSSLIFQK